MWERDEGWEGKQNTFAGELGSVSLRTRDGEIETERWRVSLGQWAWGVMEGFWLDESWVRECRLEREIGDKEYRENKRAWVAVLFIYLFLKRTLTLALFQPLLDWIGLGQNKKSKKKKDLRWMCVQLRW